MLARLIECGKCGRAAAEAAPSAGGTAHPSLTSSEPSSTVPLPTPAATRGRQSAQPCQNRSNRRLQPQLQPRDLRCISYVAITRGLGNSELCLQMQRGPNPLNVCYCGGMVLMVVFVPVTLPRQHTTILSILESTQGKTHRPTLFQSHCSNGAGLCPLPQTSHPSAGGLSLACSLR